MPVSRTIVALALAVQLPAVACTRFNPAFGDGRDTDKTSGGLDDGDDDGDDDSASAEDGGDTSDTSPTTPTEDASADASGEADDDTGGSTDTPTTTGGAACSLSEPLRFGLSVADALGNTVPDRCGTTSSWVGTVTPTLTPGELVVADCGGPCTCADEATAFHLHFTDLAPTPADLIADGETGCVSITVSRVSRADDCSVEWMFVESISSPADYPSFFAANTGSPSWSLVVPQATLGDPLDPCDSEICEPPELPGEYGLLLGADGPIAAGDTLPIELNPYAGVSAVYDVTALFAQVDEACTPRLGWAAILAP